MSWLPYTTKIKKRKLHPLRYIHTLPRCLGNLLLKGVGK